MSELTTQDVAEVVATAILEVVAATSPSSPVAVERLEDIANRLHDTVGGLADSPVRETLRSIMEHLIKIEGGAGAV